ATTEAMRNFQNAEGLKPSGKLDAITLQRLGLGSPVAGVAPPKQTASASTPPGR
ncbi:MAG: peptidoglycan-binding protein, partial [Acidobacteria bacterium]|nr:peptidoglycan-binding protein [Acidobacteriota bacterium]